MNYLTTLPSPVGPLCLASDGTRITGLWLEGQKYFAATLEGETQDAPDLPVFRQTSAWLKAYFAGEIPSFLPPLAPKGSAFRQAVWKLLLETPRGQTVTYGALAKKLREQGISAAPQAVGGAVGHNPISILIPCHRCVGSGGSLTGYAGGVSVKRYLLKLEGVDMTGLFMPKNTPMHERRKEFPYLPKVLSGPGVRASGEMSETPVPGRYPCPCCGCKTFPVPAADAVAYICPVCMWENDVFTASPDEPSDENHGMTLEQGRENYKTFGVCDIRLARYARKPLLEELDGKS
ncbi:methylated-DNA--[protein]-cysteine S-methyltransferase [uncultured Dysosmobacter sp.]|uniref:methylated-DNA--[protein]-cysteine S-methyltransferase n=1 Tax=uncultured Dysosmobacter sp. TaxID=2591384 RepID=UPI00345D9A8D